MTTTVTRSYYFHNFGIRTTFVVTLLAFHFKSGGSFMPKLTIFKLQVRSKQEKIEILSETVLILKIVCNENLVAT